MDVKKYFGICVTGRHLILDLYNGSRLNDIEYMKKVFLECIKECGATLLGMDFHHFEENSGLSGVAVLSESHISVHTWPEYNYGAFDIFMCGKADPLKAIPILKKAFNTEKIIIQEIMRGQGVDVF